MNWPKYADYADYIDCADYADYIDCVDYADYVDCADYAEYVLHSCLDKNWHVQRFLCKSQFNIFLFLF